MISATRFAVILAMSLIPALGRAQDFSADVVYLSAAGSAALPSGTDGSNHNPTKLYVSNGNMRLETHGLIGTILLSIETMRVHTLYSRRGRSMSPWLEVSRNIFQLKM